MHVVYFFSVIISEFIKDLMRRARECYNSTCMHPLTYCFVVEKIIARDIMITFFYVFLIVPLFHTADVANDDDWWQQRGKFAAGFLHVTSTSEFIA
jgi:hypothetical protein